VFELALFTDVLTDLSGVLLSVVNSDVISSITMHTFLLAGRLVIFPLFLPVLPYLRLLTFLTSLYI